MSIRRHDRLGILCAGHVRGALLLTYRLLELRTDRPKLAAVAIVAAATLWTASPGLAETPEFDFQRVVDTTMLIPEGSGTFTTVSAGIVRQGIVYFRGTGSGGQEGIYQWDNGILSRVVDLGQIAPDTEDPFVILSEPSAPGAGAVFRGTSQQAGSQAVQGIYRADGSISTYVSAGDPAPGGGAFGSFGSRPSGSGDNVAFDASLSGPISGAICARLDGELVRIADLSMRMPDRQGSVNDQPFFGAFFAPALSGDRLAFHSRSTTPNFSGVYTTVDGLRAVADVNTPIPEGVGNFMSFLEIPAFSDGNTAFIAFGSNPGPGTQHGVYAELSGTLFRIADRDMFVPEGGTVRFGFFFDLSIGGGEVVFWGSGLGSSLHGIYTTIDGGLNRVIDNTQLLDGELTQGLSLQERDAFDGSSIVFSAAFPGPVQAIYIARRVTSGVANASESHDRWRLDVSPNPSRGDFMLEYETPYRGSIEVGLYDAAGRVRGRMQTAVVPGSTAVAWSDEVDRVRLAPGVYFARVLFRGRGEIRIDESRVVVVR